jgi:hypothetical protein
MAAMLIGESSPDPDDVELDLDNDGDDDLDRTYTIDELCDRARVHAIEKIREHYCQYWLWEELHESLKSYAEELGITNDLYFNVGYGHEYVVIDFEGNVNIDAIVAEVEPNTCAPFRYSEAYATARAAIAYARANEYDVQVQSTLHRSRDGARSLDIDIIPTQDEMLIRHLAVEPVVIERVETAITTLLKDIERELLHSLREDEAYRTNDERSIEEAQNNNYLFDEDGDRLDS